MANSLRIIVFLSKLVEGKKHDKKIAEDLAPFIKKRISLGMDLGFIGLKLDKTVNQEMPVKKKRNQKLSEDEKSQNREKSRRRVMIENCIGSLKIMRIAKDIIRMHGDRVKNCMFRIAASIHNFRIISRLGICS